MVRAAGTMRLCSHSVRAQALRETMIEISKRLPWSIDGMLKAGITIVGLLKRPSSGHCHSCLQAGMCLIGDGKIIAQRENVAEALRIGLLRDQFA